MGMRRSKTIYLNNRRPSRHRDKKGIVLGVLGISIVVSGAVALMPNAYQITVDNEVIGVVSKKDYIDAALETVEAQLEKQYKTQVQIEEIDEIKKVRAGKKDLIDPNKLPAELRQKLNVTLEFQQLSIDGEVVGVIESKEVMDELKLELKKKYFDDKDVKAEFTNEIKLQPVFTTEEQLISLDDLVDLCSKREKKVVTYEVKPGDSFWKIANSLGVTPANIYSANEGMTESTPLQIGQELKVEVRVPKLGLELIKLPTSEDGVEGEKKPEA